MVKQVAESAQMLAVVELDKGHYRSEIVVASKLGLHARPASLIANLANQLDCDVCISNGDRSADGRSILQLMMLVAEQGTRLTLEVRGPDAYTAICQLTRLASAADGTQTDGDPHAAGHKKPARSDDSMISKPHHRSSGC